MAASASPDLLFAEGQRVATCAALYEHPAVRWLLGGELHPGGEDTTRRALELIGAGPGERLLDVASGAGTSALLAAEEHGCAVVGLEYAADAVAAARAAAEARGLAGQIEFREGDAEALPFADEEFDLVLCECSLCTFAHKTRAAAEIRRVLRPGGRLMVSDVVADPARLPAELRGSLAALACVGEALDRRGYERLLRGAGLEPHAYEQRDRDAAALAERVHDRLRGARLLGLDRLEGSPVAVGPALELIASARKAIADGALGYGLLAFRRPYASAASAEERAAG